MTIKGPAGRLSAAARWVSARAASALFIAFLFLLTLGCAMLTLWLGIVVASLTCLVLAITLADRSV